MIFLGKRCKIWNDFFPLLIKLLIDLTNNNPNDKMSEKSKKEKEKIVSQVPRAWGDVYTLLNQIISALHLK